MTTHTPDHSDLPEVDTTTGSILTVSKDEVTEAMKDVSIPSWASTSSTWGSSTTCTWTRAATWSST